MFQRTDDLRITQVRPLLAPAILLEEIPISDRASNVVANTRQAIAEVLEGRDPRLVVVAGPCSIHDPKAALEYAERLARLAEPFGRPPDCRDAHVFREAADVGGLERPHQRPGPRRELPHQQGAPARAQAPARRQRPGPAHGLGVSRHPDSPAYRRPDLLGGHRRADHRKPGASRAGLGAVDAGRVQERHRRRDADGRRRRLVGPVAAPVPVGDQAGRLGDLSDDRQRHLPRHPARRQPHGAQLRRRARQRRLRQAARAGTARDRDDRLLARQQPEGPPPAGRRRGAQSRGRSPAARGGSSAR